VAKLKEKRFTGKREGAAGNGRKFVVYDAQIYCMDPRIEYLEELMDLKQTVAITFRAVDGGVSTVRGHIVKMDNVSGRDIIETDAGMVIGADQVLEINGRRYEDIC
jgi:hypothetical protein